MIQHTGVKYSTFQKLKPIILSIPDDEIRKRISDAWKEIKSDSSSVSDRCESSDYLFLTIPHGMEF